MARPKKETVEFFPHMVEHGKTMFILESKWGNDGYAVWFKLLEKLGATDGHFIDCRDETTVVFLAAVCRISEDTLLAIFGILASLNAIDRDLWQHKLVYCQHLVDNLEVVYQRRKMHMPTRERVIARAGIVIDDINGVNADSNTQSRVDESRVDEIKTTTANHSQLKAPGPELLTAGNGAFEGKDEEKQGPVTKPPVMVVSEALALARENLGRVQENPGQVTVLQDICRLYPPERIREAFADAKGAGATSLNWVRKRLEANGARASPAGSLAAKVLEENRQAAREFCGVGGDP